MAVSQTLRSSVVFPCSPVSYRLKSAEDRQQCLLQHVSHLLQHLDSWRVCRLCVLLLLLAGPVLGGGLSDAFGWRSTMISLAVFGGLVTVMIAALVPETHQYIVLDRLQKKDPVAAGRIKEKEAIEQEPLVFHAPWVPLK